MGATDRRLQARLAIQAVAAQHGLPTELNILSERWNTVARLGDSDVIAKAATLADLARTDPSRWFEQEVRVSSELAAAGAPVQIPWKGQESSSVAAGFPITLWQRLDGEMAGSTEAEMVESLARLHRLGEGIRLDQQWFAPVAAEIPATLAMLADRKTIPLNQIKTLHEHLKYCLHQVERANLPEGFVHGDAQRKNSMHTSDGTIWIDLEETCIGPYAWDLACLTMNPKFDTERVLDYYAEVSGTDRVSEQHLKVLKQLRDLEGLVWMFAIQDEREPEFRSQTEEQLARVLVAANAG